MMKIFTLIFCCVIAFVAFWYGIKLIRLYFKVKKWDRATATITQKSVVKRTLGAGSRSRFKPSVDYTYKYNFKTYKGKKVFMVELIKGEQGFLYTAAENFIEKIKPEEEIYVNPKNPDEAVIYCKGIGLYFFVLVMGLMSLLIGFTNFTS